MDKEYDQHRIAIHDQKSNAIWRKEWDMEKKVQVLAQYVYDLQHSIYIKPDAFLIGRWQRFKYWLIYLLK